MQTWRTILSLFFFLFTLNLQVSALPSPKVDGGLVARAPSAPGLNALNIRADKHAHAVLADVHAKIKIRVGAILGASDPDEVQVQVHIDAIKAQIKVALGALQADVDANVDLDVILGGHGLDDYANLINDIAQLIAQLVNRFEGADGILSLLADLSKDFDGYLKLAVGLSVDLGNILIGLGIKVFLNVGGLLGISLGVGINLGL